MDLTARLPLAAEGALVAVQLASCGSGSSAPST